MSAKVLELIWSFEIGGSEKLAGQLAQEFARLDHKVLVCATHRGHDVLSRELQKTGIECLALNSEKWGRLGRIFLPFRLWWLVLKRRIDVVHAHHFFLLPVCFHAVKFAGAKLVATEHTDFDMRASDSERRKVARYCSKVKNLSVIHAGIKAYMVSQMGVPAENIKVILNGVDTSRFYPVKSLAEKNALRAKLGLPQNHVILGWVGRMHPDKDLPALLAAFGRLETDSGHLLLVGDGSERSQVELLSRTLGDGKVTIFAMRSDIPEILRSLDIFVLSSATEGMPLVILEALSSGLPIISTDVGGISASVNENCALLVRPGDPAVLAEAITILINDADKRRTMGLAARDLTTSSFDFSNTRKQYEELLFGNA